MSEIDELRAKVDLFERIIREFVETPFIYQSPSMRRLVEEMGYEYVTEKSTWSGEENETIHRKEPKP